MEQEVPILLGAVATACVTVVACVGVHLGTLLSLAKMLDHWFSYAHWRAMGVLVVMAICAHLAEMAIFAVGIRILEILHGNQQFGRVMAFEAWYRSAAAYTSMNDSNEQVLSIRLLLAVEALAGLILIAWTASFLFVVMQRTWHERRDKKSKKA